MAAPDKIHKKTGSGLEPDKIKPVARTEKQEFMKNTGVAKPAPAMKPEEELIGGKPLYKGPLVRGNIFFNGIPAFWIAPRWRPYVLGLLLVVWAAVFTVGGFPLSGDNILVLSLISLLGVAAGYLLHCVYLSTKYYFFIILKIKMLIFALSFLGLTLIGFTFLR